MKKRPVLPRGLEKLIEDRETWLQMAFDESPLTIALVDRQLRLFKANKTFHRSTGFSEKELNRHTLYEMVSSEALRKTKADRERLIRGETQKFCVETHSRDKEGKDRWVEVTVSAVRDEDGKFLCFLTTAENITERKLSEDALRESEERFRLAFEENTVGMAMTDQENRYIRVNQAFCRMLGYTEKEMLKKKISDVTHPGDFKRQMEDMANLYKGKISRYQIEKRYLTKKGETVWGALTVSKIYDRQGRFICTMGVIENITKRRRTEEALRESERRYRGIFENAPFGVFRSTIDGKVLAVNVTMARQFGYHSPRAFIEKINRNGGAKSVYDNQALRLQYVRKAVMIDGWHQFETLYRRRDGQALPGMLRFRTIPKDPVTGAELEGFVEDVSARKSAEEKIRLYQEKLRQLTMKLAFVEEKERQRIANNIHDYIGQSLSCAMLALGTLENEMPRTPKAQEALHSVRDQIEGGIRFARSATFELSPAILFKLGFGAVVEWLADRILTPNHIRYRIAEESSIKLPDNEGRVIVFRAIRELFVNVVKHAKAGGVKITMQRHKGFFEITVQDDGKGFDVLLLAKKTEGFGLFSVREQLMYIGGRMSIISKPGKGSTVSVILPVEGRKGNE